MFQISKEKSVQIKGIVILMMIFLHLFNKDHTNLCTNLLYVGDEPFSKWLSNACGPVPFFILLSGYGLAYTHKKGGLTAHNQFKRILKLYIHYWVVLAVFLIIGSFLYEDKYPGSIERMIVNFLGWKTDYNNEMWFLLPYAMIALTSKYIIRVIETLGQISSVLISVVIYFIASFIISKYHNSLLSNNQFLNWFIVYLQFLNPFTIGVCFCYAKIENKWKMPTWLVSIIMLFLVIVVATINIPGSYIVYVPVMVFLFNQLSFPKILDQVLTKLGKQSMLMWMIHTWFCYYLFQDEIYALKYPIIIFIVVVLISYFSSLFFSLITTKLIKQTRMNL